MACLALAGTIGNLLIIGAVSLSPRLRVRGNAFIVNLALVDLVITCYIMPIGLTTSQFQENPFGRTICDINAFLILITCGVSTQSLMLIALERYFHICKTKYYSKVFQPHLVAVYILITWIYTAIWAAQGWTGWTKYIYGVDIYVCLFDGTVSLSYDLSLVIFGMLLPMCVLLFCYTAIFRKVHFSNVRLAEHRRRHGLDLTSQDALVATEQNMKKEFRFVLTLFAIVLAFVVLWLPAAIVLPMSGVWTNMPKRFYSVAVWLAFCNSCVNSVIYGILNKNFRRGYANLVQRMFCCRSDENHDKCDCQSRLLQPQDESGSTATSRLGAALGVSPHREHVCRSSVTPSMKCNSWNDTSTPSAQNVPTVDREYENRFQRQEFGHVYVTEADVCFVPQSQTTSFAPDDAETTLNMALCSSSPSTETTSNIEDVDSVCNVLRVTNVQGDASSSPTVDMTLYRDRLARIGHHTKL